MAQHTILCVDDEDNILKTLRRVFMEEDEWELLTANNGKAGLELLKQHEIHLIIADYRMPEMKGTEFLKRAKEIQPAAIRIILSGFADVDVISRAINEGEVYKFISKPWNDEELKVAVRRSLEQFELIKENKRLYEKIRAQNEELRALNENLEAKVQERTAALELRNQALSLAQDILEHMPIGIMGISMNREIALINREMESLFDCGSKPALGSRVEEHLPNPVLELVAKTLERGEPIEVQEYRHKNIPLKLNIVVMDSSENSRGVMLIAQRHGKRAGEQAQESATRTGDCPQSDQETHRSEPVL